MRSSLKCEGGDEVGVSRCGDVAERKSLTGYRELKIHADTRERGRRAGHQVDPLPSRRGSVIL